MPIPLQPSWATSFIRMESCLYTVLAGYVIRPYSPNSSLRLQSHRIPASRRFRPRRHSLQLHRHRRQPRRSPHHRWQRLRLETLPHGNILQLSRPQNLTRSWSATLGLSIRTRKPSRGGAAMYRSFQIRRIALYGEHTGVQKLVEEDCKQLGPVWRIPKDRRRDWYVMLSL